jgi:NAD(P)-dependent dehydrogenase (short-subunit alcohol dehydrogenase family)
VAIASSPPRGVMIASPIFRRCTAIAWCRRYSISRVSSEGGQIAYPAFSLYHATKWGIEGFIESAAQEVAPFGIDFIIVEPGPTATNFGAGLVRASPTHIYKDTPAGAVRRSIAEGSFAVKGDARS